MGTARPPAVCAGVPLAAIRCAHVHPIEPPSPRTKGSGSTRDSRTGARAGPPTRRNRSKLSATGFFTPSPMGSSALGKHAPRPTGWLSSASRCGTSAATTTRSSSTGAQTSLRRTAREAPVPQWTSPGPFAGPSSPPLTSPLASSVDAPHPRPGGGLRLVVGNPTLAPPAAAVGSGSAPGAPRRRAAVPGGDSAREAPLAAPPRRSAGGSPRPRRARASSTSSSASGPRAGARIRTFGIPSSTSGRKEQGGLGVGLPSATPLCSTRALLATTRRSPASLGCAPARPLGDRASRTSATRALSSGSPRGSALSCPHQNVGQSSRGAPSPGHSQRLGWWAPQPPTG